MAKEQNLRPIKLSHDEAVENGRKGGKASAKAKAKKQRQRKLLELALKMKIKDIPSLQKSAAQLGLDGEKDLHTYITIATLFNTARKCDVSILKDIMELTGEDNMKEANNGILDELAEYLRGE